MTHLSFLSATAGAVALSAALAAGAAGAETQPPRNVDALVTAELIEKLRSEISHALVVRAVKAQNARLGALAQSEIDALDQQWRREREEDDKPLIAATLSSPLSGYLTRRQANELGLYAAIFVTDQNGLNVGQSAITGDYWQGDEAKFQKTYAVGPDAVFVDAPEWVEDFKVWIVQVNMTVSDPDTGAAIGAVTFDVNMAELERRAAAALSH